MSEIESCRICGKELTGAIESQHFAVGRALIIVMQATSDCNWTRCRICKLVLCRRCFGERKAICSDDCFFKLFEKVSSGTMDNHKGGEYVGPQGCVSDY